ncbi:MAG TPA: FUSC family protein [Streptosporangiaceae bacterium]
MSRADAYAGWLRVRLPSARPRPDSLLPAWSVPAALRAVRATLVVPALFALTFKVIGDLQMALFAVFGSFASLVMASFGGTRRDKAVAHLGLAVVGSVALTIGTAVSGTAWLAAIVTIPVAFAIFFAGVAGPNAASGITAALLAYVLPVASSGAVSTIPARLAGWWLAAAVSTAAVLLLSPRSPGDRLRATAAASATALAAQLKAAAGGTATPAHLAASHAAKRDLMTAFAATPYRPTGLATADQALANVVQLLEWCTALTGDALDGHLDLSHAGQADRDLLGVTADVLHDVASLLSGQEAGVGGSGVGGPDTVGSGTASLGTGGSGFGGLDIGRLEQARAASVAHQRALTGDPDRVRDCARFAFHAQAIAVAALTLAADTLVATRRASPELIAKQRRLWYGGRTDDQPAKGWRGGLAVAAGVVARHASFRSVWLLNSLRGAVGLAAAVAVADLSGVQHGFWVVLGTLSVLRSNAASTGSTALRALAGTLLGFVIGAALLLAIGTGSTALWVALPIAVLVASYAPGTAPFAVGQAAFTITVLVLFNLLAPAGWKVGLLRIQDVALGCAVSLVVGMLFWPRGAGGVVGDDLADAYRRGSAYLTQAVDWALGLRGLAPDAAVPAATAGIRLDDALRGYLAEQGAKQVPKEELWGLVMASMRLRLTAYSLAGLRVRGSSAYPDAPEHVEPERAALRDLAAELAGFYEQIAIQVGRPARGEALPAEVPARGGLAHSGRPDTAASALAHHHPQLIWVSEHLHHLGQHVAAVTQPALHVAQQRRTPWWH